LLLLRRAGDGAGVGIGVGVAVGIGVGVVSAVHSRAKLAHRVAQQVVRAGRSRLRSLAHEAMQLP